ncbi:class II aldolase/adducin family protein [Alicyclobacillus dauci]|uniref:Class II aldolase/adducin family protein n=1 Tax=Alicyclobacillus dauci TaxID=1475485 RepID=A0ABY6Z537_9BACL|nr:class II aldolase/adducin family protein [Alicyclobacillus dauci]WAH37984.1 class II aldolase/adducin family protein [Alicyclobacillus dauci]
MSENIANLSVCLAKAVRMLESIELLDMNGHISCRLPGDESKFLINARAASRASIRARDIVVCNADGKPEPGYPEPPSEVHIHAEIYRRRNDVGSIIHNHPHWQTVLGIADIPFKPVFSIGSFVENAVFYERSSLVNTREMGEELATLLDDQRAIQIRHHGAVVVGHTVEEAFVTSVFMEENAKKQYQAHLLNPDHRVLEGANLERTRESNWSPSIVRKVWNYHEEKSRLTGCLNGIEGEFVDR